MNVPIVGEFRLSLAFCVGAAGWVGDGGDWSDSGVGRSRVWGICAVLPPIWVGF